ncbi:hypothetical protein MtrunA17_Chr3g0107841 [Medicago truncatula]|uniref:Uncharacterized protein n=1 Tax=Medicago truncatula TaxID=3880 RepID=A0A396IQ91_MEDTR|nr:hypothetical protein MtrunA17_Chr3g0107841 [Medicago truncatula]
MEPTLVFSERNSTFSLSCFSLLVRETPFLSIEITDFHIYQNILLCVFCDFVV